MFTTPTQEDINAAIKRLGEIGWLKGSVQVGRKGKLTFKKTGADKMVSLGLLLIELKSGLTPAQFSAIAGIAIKHATDRLRDTL